MSDGAGAPALDIGFVRSQFPAFSQPSLSGLAFFENAGGSYPCVQVVDRLTRFYRERKVQPYGPFGPSQAAGEEMDEARARLAGLLGVGSDEVTFGPSTSQNTYVLAQAFRKYLNPGDAIIVTDQDHEANSGPWRRLVDDGIQIREWQIDPQTGHLDPAGLAGLLDGAARLVCFPHCSNVIGEINDVASICRMAHDAGALACVDGVSFAPHGVPNVAATGADIYLFSAYKTFGPHQGIMVIRRDLAMELPNQGHYFNGDSACKRLAPAGPDHAQIAASAGMADYWQVLHDHHGGGKTDAAAVGSFVGGLMRAHETTLLQPLLDAVSANNAVRLLGPARAEARAPTVALDLGRPAEPVAARLAELGIGAGGGDFYAVRPLKAMGIAPEHGVLRLSFAHYTTAAEVDRLIAALQAVL